MKIRAKDGSVIDLAILRANLDGGVPWASAILDALEAALSVPPEMPPEGFGVSALGLGRNVALRQVREAAGVIEEQP